MYSMDQLQDLAQVYGAFTYSINPLTHREFIQTPDLSEGVEASVSSKNLEGLREAITRSLFHINTITLSYDEVERTYSLWYPPLDINTVDLRDCYRVDTTYFHIRGVEVGWIDASLILTGGVYPKVRDLLSREQLDITKVKFKRYGQTQFKNNYEIYVYGDDPTEIHGLGALKDMFPHMSRKKLREMNFHTLEDRKEEIIYELGLRPYRGSGGLYVTAEEGEKFLKNPNQLMKYINEEANDPITYPKARRLWNELIRKGR